MRHSDKKIRFHPEESRSAWSATKKIESWLGKYPLRNVLMLTLTFLPAKNVTFEGAAKIWTQIVRRIISKHPCIIGYFRAVEGYEVPPWAFHEVVFWHGGKKISRLRRGKGSRPHIHALLRIQGNFFFTSEGFGREGLSFGATKHVRDFYVKLLKCRAKYSIGHTHIQRVTKTPGVLARYLTKEPRARGKANHPRPEELGRVRLFEFSRKRLAGVARKPV